MSSPAPSPAPSSPKDDTRAPVALNVPDSITIKLHLRKGTPLVQCRSTKDLPDPPSWHHNWERDSFSTLCARIREYVPADIPGVEWPADALPYVKPTRHSAGRSYQQLDEHNYVDRLKRAWRMEERRLGDITKIVVPIFAYLTSPETRSAAAQHKAVRQAAKPQTTVARERIDTVDTLTAHEVSQPGPDRALPEPEVAASSQATRRDPERQRSRQKRQADVDVEEGEYRTIRVKIDGVLYPIDLQVHVESLRSALNLV